MSDALRIAFVVEGPTDFIMLKAVIENTLQGKPMKRRLVRSGKKNLWMYKELAAEFALEWRKVTAKCSEASRFEDDFLYTFKQLSG